MARKIFSLEEDGDSAIKYAALDDAEAQAGRLQPQGASEVTLVTPFTRDDLDREPELELGREKDAELGEAGTCLGAGELHVGSTTEQLKRNDREILCSSCGRWAHWLRAICEQVLREVFLSPDMRVTRKRFCSREAGENRLRPMAACFTLLDLVLRGISQVYICDHPVCGLLIAVAVGLSSVELLLHCLLGVLASTAAGYWICRLSFEKIRNGLLGYDGALVGCTVWTFLTDGKTVDQVFGGGYLLVVTILLAAFAGMMHMTCANLFALAKLPPFTAAFNIVCLIMLTICAREGINAVTLRGSEAAELADDYTDMSFRFIFESTFRGVGQFIYADTTLGGILVVFGVFMQGRDDAFCLVLGSLTACLTARYVLQVPQAEVVAIRQGLYGYNSAGVCVVLGGGRFYRPTKGALFLGCVGAMICVFVQIGMKSAFIVNELQLPIMTFPFIVTAWMMMYTESGWIKVYVDAKRDEDRENVAPARKRWKPITWRPKLTELVRQKKRVMNSTTIPIS